ncbi:U1 snRNA associated protein, putative [Plasmodium sp. gorilla clade G3]|nr:U1 snRNA associated protein, putative [Plasmodium sp. gorilla clade G3]
MEEMRSLLDSLMGKDRDETDSKKKYSFKDENVCKYYLIDFCPHDLFPNTKSDIGRCKNIHSDILKEQLEKHEDYKYYLAKYQQMFMKTLERIIDVADMKIEKTKEKLKHMSNTPNNTSDKKTKIESINSHICDLLKQSEEAGEKGDLNKATSFNNQITMLQEEIKRLTEEMQKSNDGNLKVCEICGAMQAVGDVVQRFENHINGKQHLGFDKIRNTFNKLKEEIKEREEIIEKYRKTKYHSSDNRHSKRDRHHHRDYHDRRSSRHKKSSERHHKNHHSNKRSRKRSHSDRSKSSSVHHSNKRSRKRSHSDRSKSSSVHHSNRRSRKRSHSDRSKSSSVHNSNDRHKRRSVRYDRDEN